MQEFPKMLYHEDGRTTVVKSAEDEKKAAGFRTKPHPIHQQAGDIIVPGVNAPATLIVEKPNG